MSRARTGEKSERKRSDHWTRDRSRAGRAAVVISEKDGGILAGLCPFHAAKADEWDILTLQTRAASCRDCQRLTLALNRAAQKRQHKIKEPLTGVEVEISQESEEDEKERDNRE